MYKRYVYLNHGGMDIFYTEHELTKEECYCSDCDDYDTLIDVCDNEKSFGKLLTKLFSEGYDLAPCEDFNYLIEKYGTENQKNFYLSEEYANHGL